MRLETGPGQAGEGAIMKLFCREPLWESVSRSVVYDSLQFHGL